MLPTDNLSTDERVRAAARLRTHRLYIGVAAAVWILGIGFGARQLQSFESTPGAIGSAPPEWPVESQIARDSSRMTLVMLVHPQCSCTQASLTELAAVMERAHGRLKAWVLFAQPEDAPHPAAWIEAARLPDTQVGVDSTGAESARFGALTSGYLVLYDRSGRLRFSGGITAARGHAGENMGRNELLAALDETTSEVQRHSVFGCSLEEDTVSLSDHGRTRAAAGG
jgi:hypothetical protein